MAARDFLLEVVFSSFRIGSGIVFKLRKGTEGFYMIDDLLPQPFSSCSFANKREIIDKDRPMQLNIKMFAGIAHCP